MQQEASAAVANAPDWTDLYSKVVLPSLLILATLTWGVIELRVRAIIRLRDEKLRKLADELAAALRTDLQTKVGQVGLDALKALELAQRLETRMAATETKLDVFWRGVIHSTADILLKQHPEDGG